MALTEYSFAHHVQNVMLKTEDHLGSPHIIVSETPFDGDHFPGQKSVLRWYPTLPAEKQFANDASLGELVDVQQKHLAWLEEAGLYIPAHYIEVAPHPSALAGRLSMALYFQVAHIEGDSLPTMRQKDPQRYQALGRTVVEILKEYKSWALRQPDQPLLYDISHPDQYTLGSTYESLEPEVHLHDIEPCLIFRERPVAGTFDGEAHFNKHLDEFEHSLDDPNTRMRT